MNLREELTRITTAAEALRAEGGDPVVRKLGEIIGRAAATIESACKTNAAPASAPSDKPDRGGCAAAQPETRKPIIEDVVTMHNERKATPAGVFTLGKVAMQQLIRSGRCCTIYGAVKTIAAQAGGVASLAELLGVDQAAVCRAARAETVPEVIDAMGKRFILPRIAREDLENLKTDCQDILDESAVYTVRAALNVLDNHKIVMNHLAAVIGVSHMSVHNMLKRPDTTPEFDEKFMAVFTLKEA